MDKKEKLVPCPRCQGIGWVLPNGKLCRCCLETSQGMTPGFLPLSEVERLKLTPKSNNGYYYPVPPDDAKRCQRTARKG